jgi:hypothetical protein
MEWRIGLTTTTTAKIIVVAVETVLSVHLIKATSSILWRGPAECCPRTSHSVFYCSRQDLCKEDTTGSWYLVPDGQVNQGRELDCRSSNMRSGGSSKYRLWEVELNCYCVLTRDDIVNNTYCKQQRLVCNKSSAQSKNPTFNYKWHAVDVLLAYYNSFCLISFHSLCNDP